MEDLLWSMTQESRVLQELRKDIRGIWNDDAAREINSRYLDPHETDDQQMLLGLNQQKETLDQSKSNLESTETYAHQVEDYAAMVVDNLNSTEQEVNTAYSYYDMYAHYHSEARSRFPIIHELINQANSACGDGQQVTIHPAGRHPEKLQNVETQPETVLSSSEGKKPSPPEGWSPGGIEKGG